MNAVTRRDSPRGGGGALWLVAAGVAGEPLPSGLSRRTTRCTPPELCQQTCPLGVRSSRCWQLRRDRRCTPQPYVLMSVGKNSSFVSAILAFVLAQSLKVVTHRCAALLASRASQGWVALFGPRVAHARAVGLAARRVNEGKWDVRQIITSGGMPSSHSALVRSAALVGGKKPDAAAQVSGLTMAVGFEDGFGEPLFAACFVFSVIVRQPSSTRRATADGVCSAARRLCMTPPASDCTPAGRLRC
jgi:acid phosphatase family membrane protein YuiD